ncbi:hypothetical protein NDU88_003240 [Pleurodeles waltl]|uniref:Uncharacterized protein n=1 Tax=Pleurodeles waltl TaxID=8319 RepID=A0AAV7T5W6_PLEWA|nr:hypothetical protein NDU88_003240 [Pleurodeles waltl]
MFRSCGGHDDSPSYQGNGDAGNRLGNPNIWVPERTEKDDGLRARRAVEGKNGDKDKEESEETGDRDRNGNNKVPLEIDGQPRAGKRAETRELRHVPGGTWLTMVRSFLKGNFYHKGESDGRREEGTDSTGRGEGKIWRGQEGEGQY